MTISPYAQAIRDYFNYEFKAKLLLDTSYGIQEEMPVETLFRNEDDFTALETYALSLCRGKILDVGAGVGASSLVLQNRGFDLTALEVEAPLAEIMMERGIQKVICKNVFEYEEQNFDTVLMMMNGIGLVGTIQGLKDFLEHSKKLVSPSGQILLDSSNISYFYQDRGKPGAHYFGEIGYCYQYQDKKGKWFNWLYIDSERLQDIAWQHGWYAQILYEDETDQYLARLRLTG